MTDLDETLTNLRPGEALLYTPPNAFEIVPMPERGDDEEEAVDCVFCRDTLEDDSEIDGVCPFCDEAAQ